MIHIFKIFISPVHQLTSVYFWYLNIRGKIILITLLFHRNPLPQSSSFSKLALSRSQIYFFPVCTILYGITLTLTLYV